jgi:hypothetical protein
MVKRTGLARRTGLKRSLRGVRAKSRRRAGISKKEADELKSLHRAVVMLKAGATLDGNRWLGPCEWCGVYRPLMTCHVLSQGRYPHMKYDPENAWAGCWSCHLGSGGWHREPLLAAQWIEQKRGKAVIDALRARAQTKQKTDPADTRLYLGALKARLEGREVGHMLRKST